jgi:hypothetical protein
MSDIVKNKISGASSITRDKIIQNVKTTNSTRYDQMIITGDTTRNDVFYIYYSAKYASIEPKKIVFALVPDVKFVFESFMTGGELAHGVVSTLDNALLNEIKKSNALIAEKSFGKEGAINDVKNSTSLQFLKQGFLDSKEAKMQEAEALGERKVENSVIGSLKKVFSDSPDGENEVDDDDDDDDDFFGSIEWFDSGVSDANEYQNLKNTTFQYVNFEFNGDKPATNQPLLFVPSRTTAEDCKACKGDGKLTCPTCKGSGKFKCKGYVGKGHSGGAVSNKHYACSKGYAPHDECDGKGCSGCNKGRITCPTCGPINGNGMVPCERKYGSKYGIGKLADRLTGKSYCGGSGQIDCKPCKATGRIGTLVYLKMEVQGVKSEFFKYTNQQIEQFKKSPSLLYPYLNKASVKAISVFRDDNSSRQENMDDYSSNFIEILNREYGLKKGNDYPRILHEEMYYDVIPLVTLEYNHILTSTLHLFSAIPTESGFDVLFHSDPTAVKKFSVKNIWLIYKSKWSEALMTTSYKAKRDKYNEIRMLIYVAKADGTIAEEEKLVLANTITGLTEYTAAEKTKLFSLMSSQQLPSLQDDDFVISTKERAEVTFGRLYEMVLEDGLTEKPEVLLVNEYKQRINQNLGKYPPKFKQFLRTWQASLTALFLLVGAIYSVIFFFYLKPREEALELHELNLLKKNALLGFVDWVNEDTTNNVDFETFVLTSDILNNPDGSTNDDLEEELNKYNSAESLLSSINHDGSYLVDGSKKTYSEYWKKEIESLQPKITSLTKILSIRQQRLSENSNVEKNTEKNEEKNNSVQSLYDLSLEERIEGAKVSEPDGSYYIDDAEYIVEGGEIILVSPISQNDYEESGDGYEEEVEGDY